MTTKKLTDKQKRFVAEYLVDLNGRQAAIRAGYSARSAHEIAHQLAKKPEIAAAIAVGQGRQLAKLEMSATEVLRELAQIARSDIGELIEWDEKKVKVRKSKDLDPAVRKTIGEVVAMADGSVRIKLHDKLGALDKLARHHGLLKERISHENPDGSALAPQHDKRQIARAVLALLRSGQSNDRGTD